MSKKEKKTQKEIIKKFSFTTQELNKLHDLQAGIVISQAQLDGMQIYKNVVMDQVHQRLGIQGNPPQGFSKSISYNLAQNEIIYRETPIPKEEPKKEEAVAKN